MTKRHDIVHHLVQAITTVEGTTPQDLNYTLYEHIDTDIIRKLIASEYTDWELTFQVPDHEVEIRANGQILVDGELIRDINPPVSTRENK